MQLRKTALLLLCCSISLIIFTRQQCPQPAVPTGPAAVSDATMKGKALPSDQQTEITAPLITQGDTKQAQRSIKVKNNITDKMLKHPKAFGYMPAFSVSVNNTEIAQGQERDIPLEDDKLIVEYRYNYLKGYRTGSKKIQFSVPVEKNEVNLGFDWSNDQRILTSEAKLDKVLEEINK